MADAATIAERTDLAATARTLTGALDSLHQPSPLLHDATLDPRTRDSARGAQQLLSHLAAVPDAGVTASPQDSWVNPRDLTARRDITPPAPIREVITHQIRTVAATSHALAAASTAATAPATTPLPARSWSTQEPSRAVRALHRTGPVPQGAAGQVRP